MTGRSKKNESLLEHDTIQYIVRCQYIIKEKTSNFNWIELSWELIKTRKYSTNIYDSLDIGSLLFYVNLFTSQHRFTI